MPAHKKQEDLQKCKIHGIMYDKNRTPICMRCSVDEKKTNIKNILIKKL